MKAVTPKPGYLPYFHGKLHKNFNFPGARLRGLHLVVTRRPRILCIPRGLVSGLREMLKSAQAQIPYTKQPSICAQSMQILSYALVSHLWVTCNTYHNVDAMQTVVAVYCVEANDKRKWSHVFSKDRFSPLRSSICDWLDRWMQKSWIERAHYTHCKSSPRNFNSQAIWEPRVWRIWAPAVHFACGWYKGVFVSFG